MSAVFRTLEARLEALSVQWLDAILPIEQSAYEHPWSRGNFADSLRAGYEARVLVAGDTILGYFIAMKGVDEVHLLNLTVTPAWQGQGWGSVLLDALATWSRGHATQWLWLEVRRSNGRAQRMYERHGFRRVGERKGYYPAANGMREDAVVMSLRL